MKRKTYVWLVLGFENDQHIHTSIYSTQPIAEVYRAKLEAELPDVTFKVLGPYSITKDLPPVEE